MNVPYGDAWYIPGGDSYMSRLVRDAGGEVMGSRPGTAASRVVSLEEAYKLSQSADIWLNPGPCRSREDLMAFHHSFRMFGPVEKGLPIYNNTLRVTPEGGNDFWESGSVRPDLILQDLIAIFSEPEDSLELEYHFKVK
jgi:iron complex transport system substrate-binding protein